MCRIVTNRLIIEPSTNEVAEGIAQRNGCHPSMDDFLASLSPESMLVIRNNLSDLKSLYSSLTANADAAPRLVFSATHNKGCIIGYIALKNPRSDVPEIQLELLPEWQHMGFGYELLVGFIAEALRDCRIKAFLYRVRPDNTSSIKLVEKVGGKLQTPQNEAEAILLKAYLIERNA